MRSAGANPTDAKSEPVLVVVEECHPKRRTEVLFASIHVGPHGRPVVNVFTEQIQPLFQPVLIQQPGLAIEQVFELLSQTDAIHDYRVSSFAICRRHRSQKPNTPISVGGGWIMPGRSASARSCPAPI